MTALPSPALADKLAKIAGMFGSTHDGERAAAAALADRLVRSAGLSWGDVIRAPALPPRPLIGTAGCIDLAAAIAGFHTLTLWEQRFVVSLRGRPSMSNRQREVLRGIAAKVRSRGP